MTATLHEKRFWHINPVNAATSLILRRHRVEVCPHAYIGHPLDSGNSAGANQLKALALPSGMPDVDRSMTCRPVGHRPVPSNHYAFRQM
jgi:hypothetical protein